MTTIALHEPIATGIPVIDGNHQHLLQIISRIEDMMALDPQRAIDADTLARLMRFAESQLSREEDLMLVTGYLELPSHQLEHRRAKRFFHDRQNDHLDGRMVPCSTILAFLSGWLSGHVLRKDLACAAYLGQTRGTTP